MSFKFSGASLQKLADVHPDLSRLAKRVIARSRIDFGIAEGARSPERQAELLKEKKTTTLNSLHLIQDDGFAHAIDITPFVNGKFTTSEKYYRPIIQAFVTESILLGVQVEFGALWKDFFDAGHIQLNPRFYS